MVEVPVFLLLKDRNLIWLYTYVMHAESDQCFFVGVFGWTSEARAMVVVLGIKIVL